MASCFENEGFESDSYWQESGLQGGVADRHVAGGHTGSFEAKTDTTAPTGILALASIHKNPVSFLPKIGNFVDVVGTISWWIKIVAEALNGWQSFDIMVGTFDGVTPRKLIYVHRAADIALPSDTATLKYIDMGTSKPVVWTLFSRNLRDDYFNKYGALTHAIARIQYDGKGRNAPDTRGQDLRIDDAVLDTLSSRGANPGRAGGSINVPSQEV